MRRFLTFGLIASFALLISCGRTTDITVKSSKSPADPSSILIAVRPPNPSPPASPVIDSVTPAELGIDGGEIIITGQKFSPTSSIVVTVGGVPATQYVSVTPTSITAVAPPAPALGPVSVTVTSSQGSAALDGALSYRLPQIVGYIAPPELMETIGVMMTPQGLLVEHKGCNMDPQYQFDLMDLTDPANPALVKSYSDLESLVADGILDPSVLDWAVLNPSALFSHPMNCGSACDNAIFAAGSAVGHTVVGNVVIHGGVNIVCLPEGETGDGILIDGSSGIYDNYVPVPDEPALPMLGDPIEPLPDDTGGETLEPKVSLNNCYLSSTEPNDLNTTTEIQGIVITDLFNPSTPQIYVPPQLPVYDPPPSICTPADYRFRWFVRDGDLAITSYYQNTASLSDVSMFEYPTPLGELLLTGPDEVFYRFNGFDLEGGYGIAVYKNTVENTYGIYPFDVTNPASPVVGDAIYSGEIDHIYYPNLTHDGRWAWMSYISNPYGITISDATKMLVLMDWSVPLHPTVMGGLQIDGVPHDLAQSGRYVYAAQGDSGLLIVDSR